MPQADDDQLLEFHDGELDPQGLMHMLRERMERRRQQAAAQGLDYFHLVDEPEPAAYVGAELSDMAAQIEQLRLSTESLRQLPLITDWHVPIVNAPIQRLKRALHALVLMYVNVLAGRQMAVNRALAGALLQAVNAQRADAARLEALEDQVARLREQLEMKHT